ncbi:SixA phosphatase family protein [Photobacterium gaetbulicola]|uniref:SixA phosphatase family protein n=1 Tax=Photobacterium gaetbulicola TaxID=1295392 RepID=UPI00068EC2AD|nr:histidine phosphatase family protein [Photobacterium gaetbulicola]
MKLLFLVRHGKSQWGDPTLDDHERPLNNRGLKNIPKMIHRLNGWQQGPQLIVTSSALRAAQTAYLFSQGLECAPKLESNSKVYTESAFELMDIIHESSDVVDRLMLVGHNPAITVLAQMFGFKGDNIPTCGVAVFGFEVDCWQAIAEEQGTLFYYDYPKRPRPDCISKDIG